MDNEQLVLRIKAGEDVAENMLQLWKQNKGFIISIAKRYSSSAELEDLEQESYIAFCNAVDGYDHEQGMGFLGYAKFYLQRQFERCANNSRSIPLPFNASSYLFKYKRIYAKFYKEYNRKPIDDEMKRFLNVNDKEYDSIKKALYSGNTSSMDNPIDDSGEITLGDCIQSEECYSEDIERKLDHEAMQKDLWSSVDKLGEQESKIIKLQYKENMTRADAGRTIGIGYSKVCDLDSKAKRRLRAKNSTYKKYFHDYLGNCYHNVSIREFSSTWTSRTEKEALRNYYNSRRQSVAEELDAILKESDAELKEMESEYNNISVRSKQSGSRIT